MAGPKKGDGPRSRGGAARAVYPSAAALRDRGPRIGAFQLAVQLMVDPIHLGASTGEAAARVPQEKLRRP